MHKIKEAAIFFDRDGVLIDAPLINKKPTSALTVKDIKLCKNILKIIQEFPDKEKVLREISEKLYRRYKNEFRSTRVYADEFMLAYTSKFLKLNIVVVGSNGTVTSGTGMVKSYPTIFLYNYMYNHYEPLIGMNGQKLFDWNQTRDILRDNTYLINF